MFPLLISRAGGAAVTFPSWTEVAWGFGLVTVMMLVEWRLARRWNRAYSTFGIPFFVRRVERANGLEGLSLDALQRVSSSFWVRNLIFRRLDPDLIVFRQRQIYRFLGSDWRVRGFIRREEAAPAVIVIGLMNWYEVVGTIIAMVWMRDTLWIEPLIVAGFWFSHRMYMEPFRRLAAALDVAPASTPAGLAASPAPRRRPAGRRDAGAT